MHDSPNVEGGEGRSGRTQFVPWMGLVPSGTPTSATNAVLFGLAVLVALAAMAGLLNWAGSALAASASWWWSWLGWFICILYGAGLAVMFAGLAWPVFGRGALALASPWHGRLAAILWSVAIITGCLGLTLAGVFTCEGLMGRPWYGFASASGFWDSVAYTLFLAAITTLAVITTTQSQHLVRVFQRSGVRIDSDGAETLPTQPPLEPATLVHWSDLHVGRTPTTALFGKEVAVGNDTLRRIVSRHRATLDAAEALLVTGDITDRGHPEEWRNAFEILDEFSRKLVLVPGNHDLNLAELPYSTPLGHAITAFRCLLAMARAQGDRAYVGPAGGQVPLTTLLERAPPFPTIERVSIAKSMQAARSQQQWTADIRRLWERAFPMAVRVGIDLTVIVLNSNARNTGLIDNALGRIPKSQLEQAAALYEQLAPSSRVIFACHHHLEVVEGAMGTFLAVVNAHEVHDLLPDRANLFHGHRHFEYHRVTKAKGIVLHSAPSTTLGHEGARDDALTRKGAGFYAYNLVREGDRTRASSRSWYGL